MHSLPLRQFDASVRFSNSGAKWPEVRLLGFLPPGPIRAELLLFHDLGGQAIGLTDLGKALSDHGFRVWVPDLPGHGATAARVPRGQRDFSELVAAVLAQADSQESHHPWFLGGLGWGAAAALNVAAGELGDTLTGVILIEPIMVELPAVLQPVVRAGVGWAQRIAAAEAFLGRWHLDWLLDHLPVKVPVVASQIPVAALPYRIYRAFSGGPDSLKHTFWCENPVLALLPMQSDCIDVARAATQIAAFGTGFTVVESDRDPLSLAGAAAHWIEEVLANPVREEPKPIYPPGLPKHPSHRKPTWIG